MPRRNRRIKSNHASGELAALNFAISQAKLAKLEADLSPRPLTPDYSAYENRYEDLPPLHPDDAARLEEELIELLTVDEEKRKKEKHDWYMSMAHWAP